MYHAVLVACAGSAIYVKWGSSDPQSYGPANNQPFAFEERVGLTKLLSRMGKGDSEADGGNPGDKND